MKKALQTQSVASDAETTLDKASVNSQRDSAAPTTLQVVPKASRRRFTASYKARILAEVATLEREPGAVGELLRREGLYSSLISQWKSQASQATHSALARKRGRKGRETVAVENEALRRRVKDLEEELRKAEVIIDVQKKLSTLLGISIPEKEAGR